MTLLYGFDFGETTGIACGHFDVGTPYQLNQAWEVLGGASGFLEWFRREFGRGGPLERHVAVAEKFVLNPGNQFAADLTGVPIEGALAALWRGKLYWQPPSAKAGIPDTLLHEHGLWQTGESLDHTDGRDANDAIIHSLEFLRRSAHLPTLKHYFPSKG